MRSQSLSPVRDWRMSSRPLERPVGLGVLARERELLDVGEVRLVGLGGTGESSIAGGGDGAFGGGSLPHAPSTIERRRTGPEATRRVRVIERADSRRFSRLASCARYERNAFNVTAASTAHKIIAIAASSTCDVTGRPAGVGFHAIG